MKTEETNEETIAIQKTITVLGEDLKKGAIVQLPHYVAHVIREPRKEINVNALLSYVYNQQQNNIEARLDQKYQVIVPEVPEAEVPEGDDTTNESPVVTVDNTASEEPKELSRIEQVKAKLNTTATPKAE